MFEKVNKFHPDKLADRIAGAITDYCVGIDEDAKVAVEVLLGHGDCKIIGECSVPIAAPEHREAVFGIVERIAGPAATEIGMAKQDPRLSANQREGARCGDNGIFKGVKPNGEEMLLADICATLEADFPADGKCIIDARRKRLIVCQSNASEMKVRASLRKIEALKGYDITVNPLGEWTGGTHVDTGAVNRKLGSDMGRAVTGGGLWGKDLSKADVTLNVVCHIFAEKSGFETTAFCAIGDDLVRFTAWKDGKPHDDWYEPLHYCSCVEIARGFVERHGGFEKLAEHGLVREHERGKDERK